jgi:hypothetical protein
MSHKFFNKGNTLLFGALAVVALVVGGTFYSFSQSDQSAKASGLTPTITPQVASVSTAGTITYAFPTSAAMAIGSKVFLTYPNTYTGTLSTGNVTVNSTAPSAVTNAVGASTTTSTITLAAAVSSGATLTVSLNSALTTPSTAGNYSITFTSSAGDLGGNFQYVGSANIVNVTAAIPVSLSFVIRNTGDTANTNICDLGTASTASVSSCSYRLKIATNAKNGYLVSFLTDGALTDGTNNITDAAAGSAGTAIAAGTESYGVNITSGSITGSGGSMTLANAYSTIAANVIKFNTASNTTILTANKPNSPAASGDTTNTSLVTHKLAISSNTGAGNYTQNITYFVSPAF